MNQVPNTPESGLNWQDVKSRFREILLFLPMYLKNPLEGMKHVPSWDWPTVLILEILLTAVTSVLGGILAHHWLALLGGILLGPIMGLAITFVLSGTLYYACLFIMRTELEFRKVFVVTVLAMVPSQILGVVSVLARPITLICLIVTALLLIVGLVENFMLDKKKVTQIVGSIAAFVILAWLYATVIDATSSRIKVQDYTPETLDQIHKELGN